MAAGNAVKAKEVLIPREKKSLLYDMVKTDGQFKEMVTMQELARNAWESRWGFMNKQNILQIYSEKAAELNLDPDFMVNRRSKKTFEREYNNKHSLIKSPPVPTLTSAQMNSVAGMIGWRSSNKCCSLEIVGPLYISPTSSIDPPRREQDLPHHQTNIYLG